MNDKNRKLIVRLFAIFLAILMVGGSAMSLFYIIAGII